MSTENPYASPSMPASAPREVPQLEPPQSVSYQPTLQDLVYVFEHISRGHEAWRRYFRRRQRIVFALAAGAAAASGLIAWSHSVWSLACGLFAFTAVALTLVALWLPDHLIKRYREQFEEGVARENYSMLSCVVTTSLLPGGFQASDPRGHWFRKWESIPMVEQTESMLLIYFADTSAYGIPEREFFNEAAFEGYCNLAQRLWREAHPEDSLAKETATAG